MVCSHGLPPKQMAEYEKNTTQFPVNIDERFTMAERWAAISEPGSEPTIQAAADFVRKHGNRRTVLNCAIPLARAKELTDIEFPAATTAHDCLVASGSGRFPQELNDWKYEMKIRPATQLPHLATLLPEYKSLKGLHHFP